MSDYLSGISAVNSSSFQGAKSKPLTEETKKKLEALGVDTKNIKTEDEGQKKLKEIQSVQQNQQVQQTGQNQQIQEPNQQQQSGSMSQLIKNIKELASDAGVTVGFHFDIEEIFKNIQAKITELKTYRVNSVDEDSKAKASSLQYRYDNLYTEYQSKKKSQGMLTGSLAGLASYNMAMIK